jgi:HAD superfamily hydrolase (TIGR01459 family)
MSLTIPTARLEELVANYDIFLIDQFGVLRDDVGAYPGAVAALAALKAAGRTVIILSNSGRSGDYNADRLVTLGFERSSFDRFVTSGDVAYEILSKDVRLISGRTRCVTISSGGDTNLADRLGLITVDAASDADVVVISGSEAEHISLDGYRALLRPAAERNAPCYCTNPDIHKLAGGARWRQAQEALPSFMRSWVERSSGSANRTGRYMTMRVRFWARTRPVGLSASATASSMTSWVRRTPVCPRCLWKRGY